MWCRTLFLLIGLMGIIACYEPVREPARPSVPSPDSVQPFLLSPAPARPSLMANDFSVSVIPGGGSTNAESAGLRERDMTLLRSSLPAAWSAATRGLGKL